VFESLEGLGSACSPVAFHLRQGMREPLLFATRLLAQAYLFSTFGLLDLTTFISGSPVLAIPPDSSPRPLWC
jgi:hypothetical protein